MPRVTNQDIVQASKTLTEDVATRNMLSKDIFHSERLSFFLKYHDEVRSYHEKRLLMRPGKEFQEEEDKTLEKIVLEGVTVDSFENEKKN